jgi:peptidoglycan hydrolase-like protein with peptidoglycan-binding domain
MRRVVIVSAVVVLVVSGVGTASVLTRANGESEEEAATPTSSTTTSSTTTSTTTTTLPPLTAPPPNPSGIVNPIEARLPPAPPEGVGPGATGTVVEAYQSRLAELRFDPGPIDGQYGPAVEFAVQALQKFKDLPVTGVIGQAEVAALNRVTSPEPLEASSEPNRTEVDIPRQTLTLYEGGQPRLLTTMSSGSGEHYCYETPKDNPTERVCEVANTPGGRFTYYLFRPGWDVGVLGGLYNPFYFNAGVAVHGYQSVPVGPASHGCVRIPMHIAEYFHTLVHRGDAVYVIGGKPFQVLSREPLVPPAAPDPTPDGSAAAVSR